MTLDEDQARRFNDRLVPAIRAWGDRVYAGLTFDPQSSLAADDAMPVSGASVSWLVCNSLVQAVDNLVCLIETVHGALKLYITAMDSLLRSAFVGAVQAQWILQPSSRVVRQNRALVTWQDDWRNRVKTLDLAASWYGERHSETFTTDRQRLETSIADAKAWTKATRASGALAGEPRDYVMIDIVGQVAATAFPSQTDAMIRSVGLAYTWKRLSSSVHATPTSGLRRLDRTSVTTDPRGAFLMSASADLNELISDLSGIALVLSDAWRLFDLRSQLHAPGT